MSKKIINIKNKIVYKQFLIVFIALVISHNASTATNLPVCFRNNSALVVNAGLSSQSTGFMNATSGYLTMGLSHQFTESHTTDFNHSWMRFSYHYLFGTAFTNDGVVRIGRDAFSHDTVLLNGTLFHTWVTVEKGTC